MCDDNTAVSLNPDIFLQPTPFNNMNHELVFKVLWLVMAFGNILFFVARGLLLLLLLLFLLPLF